ncbi:MmcQ/YjbR family DNA-binding protein [Rhizobium rhizosphaerae]|uniref:MmcQ/YjbR family DNA-binding protein n=1 Tax=Xaviernesmea rhizosphaerae TaxID=1672749 RepID=UPI00094FB7C6|nr:MmcQ/YjbR family DNA-binding protein [Xaviernesmea rhizosphaerae]
MGIGIQTVRELALALPGVIEVAHHERTAFRTKRKIFCTVDSASSTMNLMFDPYLRDFYCEQHPSAFRPFAGAWGAKGATLCHLHLVDEALATSAIAAAYGCAAPI